ncbi:MAG: class I SAM-dependent methyltransferase [Acidobacteriota bacterium]|nr:class I SAM-dependent methyltransferase [Acidobacteriota bacterium]
MLVQRGKKQERMDSESFHALTQSYESLQIDLGTGDGRFVLREARERPTRLCIGLDAVGDNLAPTASKAMRKPAKGGAPNALFVIAPVERMPEMLRGKADRITVNFPWGSLLNAVVEPDRKIMADILSLGAPNAGIELLINYYVFTDPGYLERLNLPTLDQAYLKDALLPAYKSLGMVIEEHRFISGQPPHRTSWGQRLSLGSGRETLLVTGRVPS